jgi:hypothetical protein
VGNTEMSQLKPCSFSLISDLNPTTTAKVSNITATAQVTPVTAIIAAILFLPPMLMRFAMFNSVFIYPCKDTNLSLTDKMFIYLECLQIRLIFSLFNHLFFSTL